jgi:hypothetical protein
MRVLRPDVDAAGDDPGVDVRRHRPVVAAHDAARLDRVEGVDAGLEVGAAAAPAAKRRVERLAGLAIARVRVPAVGIGLPDLDQHVLQHRADAVEDAALDADALAFGAFGDEDAAEVVLEDVEAGGLRRQADVDVRAGGLRGGLAADDELRAAGGGEEVAHRGAPFFGSAGGGACTWFSNSVARWPRRTMSKR